MGLTVEDAKFVADCRKRMIDNMTKGLAPDHGIDKSLLKEAYAKLRKERTLGAATGAKPKAKASETVPIDLDAFLKK